MKFKFLALAATVSALLSACGGNSTNPISTVNSTCTGTEVSTSRLFLQQLSDTSVILKWRGDTNVACIGTNASNMTIKVLASTTAGDHKEAKFTGLSPDTAYYYSIGGSSIAPVTQTFRTAPTSGYPANDGNVRIWVVGDSGTAGYLHSDTSASTATTTAYPGVADAVRQGMNLFTKASGQNIDMMLMLGDNAYNNGDDANYQEAVFNTYKAELKNVALWPTIGNHEMGVVDGSALYGYPAGTVFAGGLSTSSNPNSYILDKTSASSPTLMPYLNIFSTPIAGEAGGIASGTKQYYSFNYGKVHVVSLDSQLSARDATQRATMKSWLDRDLADASTKADWTIVIFHHPPYSKGANHDSDSTAITMSIDRPQIDMRNEFVPVFQKYGGDLVLNGHSHSYERSYYMKDLYAGTTGVVNGDSNEFVAATHAYGKGFSGRSAAGEEYKKTAGYVVYSAAGNGGKADHDYGSMRVIGEWLNHAAHVFQPFWNWVGAQVAGSSKSGLDHKRGLAIPGSVLIDANKDRLEVQMLNQTGQVLDQFLIKK